MFNDFVNKKFRHAFLAENIKAGLAFQIRAIRERQKLSQPELAKKATKTQSVISRLEDPNYGSYTIRTLLDLAGALDVALLVKFVSYSRLAQEIKDVSPEALAVPSYVEEQEIYRQRYSNVYPQIAGSGFVTDQSSGPNVAASLGSANMAGIGSLTLAGTSTTSSTKWSGGSGGLSTSIAGTAAYMGMGVFDATSRSTGAAAENRTNFGAQGFGVVGQFLNANSLMRQPGGAIAGLLPPNCLEARVTP